MIAAIVALLDRLFPPTVERIVSSLKLAHDRLASHAAAQHREANRQLNLADIATAAAATARQNANNASTVKNKIAALINPEA